MNRPMTFRPFVNFVSAAGWMVLALVVLAVGGCGGGSGGTSAHEEYQRAMTMANPEQKALALIRVANMQADSGDAFGAGESLGEAAKAAESIDGARGRAEVLNSIASAYGKVNQGGEARKLVGKIEQAAGQIEDLEVRVGVLARLGLTQAMYVQDTSGAAGTLQQAEQDNSQVERLEGRVAGLVLLARAWHGAGRSDDAQRLIDEALAIARGIEATREQADTLLDIAEGLRRIEKGEDAKTILVEAREAVQRIESPLSRAYALVELAGGYQAMGDVGGFEECLDEAHKLGDQVDAGMRPELMQKIDQARR